MIIRKQIIALSSCHLRIVMCASASLVFSVLRPSFRRPIFQHAEVSGCSLSTAAPGTNILQGAGFGVLFFGRLRTLLPRMWHSGPGLLSIGKEMMRVGAEYRPSSRGGLKQNALSSVRINFRCAADSSVRAKLALLFNCSSSFEGTSIRGGFSAILVQTSFMFNYEKDIGNFLCSSSVEGTSFPGSGHIYFSSGAISHCISSCRPLRPDKGLSAPSQRSRHPIKTCSQATS